MRSRSAARAKTPSRRLCGLVCAASLLVLVSLTVWMPAASAATKTETRSETKARGTTFRGMGCTGVSQRTLFLPADAFGAVALSPQVEQPLISAESDEPVALVQSVTIDGTEVTWSVAGTGASCDPGLEAVEWETEDVTLRVRYKVRVRVLTRGTVITRGDRICRKYGRQIAAVPDRSDSVSAGVRDLRSLARMLRGMNRSLGDLAVPKERRSSFVNYRSALDRAQQRLEAAADAAEDYNVGGLNFQVRKFGFAIDSATRHAKRYGFRSCSGRAATS